MFHLNKPEDVKFSSLNKTYTKMQQATIFTQVKTNLTISAHSLSEVAYMSLVLHLQSVIKVRLCVLLRLQMNMLLRLQEAANYSSTQSCDSDSTSHHDDQLDSSLESAL